MTIDQQILAWFEKYHTGEENEKMCELYENLVDEKISDTLSAIYKGNVVESFSGFGHLYRGAMGAWNYYFNSDHSYIADRYYDRGCLLRKLMGEHFAPVMEEIVKSMNSKDFLNKKDLGKVEKGKKFVRPDIALAIGFKGK